MTTRCTVGIHYVPHVRMNMKHHRDTRVFTHADGVLYVRPMHGVLRVSRETDQCPACHKWSFFVLPFYPDMDTVFSETGYAPRKPAAAAAATFMAKACWDVSNEVNRKRHGKAFEHKTFPY